MTNVTAEKNIVTDVVIDIFLGARRITKPAATPQKPPSAIPNANLPNKTKLKLDAKAVIALANIMRATKKSKTWRLSIFFA
ncbi:hypothetical protein BML2526_32940 [Providencia rettgeri]|nr:hypothetical protein BML2526_32940 [Providencia rettgeri]BBV12732.1 hypothetical protein BML2576_21910 [Providencia rettgeri]BDH18835.1 hypothetical protein PrNR1418_21260 [Providencia rettgeri]